LQLATWAESEEMAYFPNGTAGMMYEAEFCDRCVHQNGPDGESGCAVMLAHMLHNYAECNKEDSILHLLIPRTKDGCGAEQCKMFIHDGKDHETGELFP
jgi:hypothetical protein